MADYTREVARGLSAEGDQVEVWAPPCHAETDHGDHISVLRLPDHFGVRSLVTLQRGIRQSADSRVLVQFVPHAFGWRAMNLPLCIWLSARYRKSLIVMFHEVSYPITREQSLRHNFLGVVTRMMALTLAGSAREALVATPAWARLLRLSGIRGRKVHWCPVPSNVPVVKDTAAVDAIRSRLLASGSTLIGHFGTYGPLIANSLIQIFPMVLSQNRGAVLLLLGRGSEAFREHLIRAHPWMACRTYATGGLAPENLSCHIASCDLFVQFYPDGVSCRRGSIMAVLAHGRAIVTTCGPSTESIWRESRAAALAQAGHPAEFTRLVGELVGDEAKRRRFESAASALYDKRFDIRHTIFALRRNRPGIEAPDRGPN